MKKRELKKLYLSHLPEIRKVAKNCGYAIGLHGSLTRDFDLIAVPWIKKTLLEKTLVKRIAKTVDGEVTCWGTYKPHGRRVYVIMFNDVKYWGKMGSPYIDLSIVPFRFKK